MDTLAHAAAVILSVVAAVVVVLVAFYGFALLAYLWDLLSEIAEVTGFALPLCAAVAIGLIAWKFYDMLVPALQRGLQ